MVRQTTFNYRTVFYVKSIQNDTDYVVSIMGPKTLVSFFGSVEDTGVTDPVYVVGATQIPKKTRGKKKRRTNDFKITMIVFIVLFAVMLISLLILYFTGMMKFQLSRV